MIGAARPVLAPAAGSTESRSRSLSALHPVPPKSSPGVGLCQPISRGNPLIRLPIGPFPLRIRHRKAQKAIQYPRTRSGFVQ